MSMRAHPLFMIVVAVLVLASSAGAQPTTVFHGRPSLKISEGGMERVPVHLNEATSAPVECVVTEEDGRYYWASRNDTPLGRVQTGAFTTYVALNGTGYVRVMRADVAETGFPVSPAEERFEYVEHILFGLASITYYGRAVPPDAGP